MALELSDLEKKILESRDRYIAACDALIEKERIAKEKEKIARKQQKINEERQRLAEQQKALENKVSAAEPANNLIEINNNSINTNYVPNPVNTFNSTNIPFNINNTSQEVVYYNNSQENKEYNKSRDNIFSIIAAGILTLGIGVGLYLKYPNEINSWIGQHPLFKYTPTSTLTLAEPLPTSIVKTPSGLEIPINTPTNTLSQTDYFPTSTVKTPSSLPFITPKPIPTYDYISTGDNAEYDINYKFVKQAESTTETINLSPGDVLFISATQYKIGDVSCFMNDLITGQFLGRVCTYFKEAGAYETIVIEDLIPGHSKIAVTDQLTIQQAIEGRLPSFFEYPNCINGCSSAFIEVEKKDGSKYGIVTNAPESGLPNYRLISLAHINSEYQFATIDYPQGTLNLKGIPFDTNNAAITQCQNELSGKPTEYVIDINWFSNKVYLLFSGGHAISGFAGNNVGEVQLLYHDGTIHHVPLIVGENLRDWSFNGGYGETETTSPDVQEAYRGTVIAAVNGEEGQIGILDMMSLDIDPSKVLSKIIITDNSYNTTGINPCIQFYGVTIEVSTQYHNY